MVTSSASRSRISRLILDWTWITASWTWSNLRFTKRKFQLNAEFKSTYSEISLLWLSSLSTKSRVIMRLIVITRLLHIETSITVSSMVLSYLQDMYRYFELHNYDTVKSRFNESRFKVKSRFKVWNLVTKMKFHITKTQFSAKSRFKEPKCADGGHSLNRDFTVFHCTWW